VVTRAAMDVLRSSRPRRRGSRRRAACRRCCARRSSRTGAANTPKSDPKKGSAA